MEISKNSTTCYPMWDDITCNHFCYSDAGIEAKAFSLFYIFVLWPDLIREIYKQERRDGDFICSPNGNEELRMELTCF